MRGWAFGLLKLPRSEFYEMRVGEFWEALREYREEKKADRAHLGELVRGSTLRMFNLQLKPGDRINDPRKFWPMPWDDTRTEAEETQRLSKLNAEERNKEIDNFYKRIGRVRPNQENGKESQL